MWTENPQYDQITDERSVDVVLIPEVCALGVKILVNGIHGLVYYV